MRKPVYAFFIVNDAGKHLFLVKADDDEFQRIAIEWALGEGNGNGFANEESSTT